MTTALRPLSTGELLDRTFSLYRNHFGLFVGIFALPYLSVFAFQCLALVFQTPGVQLTNVLMSSLWGLGTLFLSVVVSAVSQAATVMAVSNLYLGRDAHVKDSLLAVKGQVLGVMGLSFLVSFVSMLACLAFIVPGVLLFIMWSVSVPAKVLENRGVLDSMSRSMDLTKGSRGRIFVIGLLIVGLTFAVRGVLQWPILIAAGFSMRAGGVQQLAPGWQAATIVAGFVGQALVGALASIAFSLVYYDERVRKEAFDLQLMMMTLDGTAEAPSSPAQVGA
jgi:hypothetical protein